MPGESECKYPSPGHMMRYLVQPYGVNPLLPSVSNVNLFLLPSADIGI